MTTHATDYQALLDGMDHTFEGFYDWLAGQYDRDSGGFYYARSSIESGQFAPDIESTAQALNILERSELMDGMPEELRRKFTAFFQARQDPESGLFLDEHPAMRKDAVMVARAIGYSTTSLRKLGGQPLYPVGGAGRGTPEFMRSERTFAAWLRSVDLRNSWRGCDRLSSTTAFILRLPEAERQAYYRQAHDYFAEIQDPETGLWGDGSLYVRISGTFKMHTFYSSFDLPLPNAERIVRSVLTCLRSEQALDMCYIRNPIHLLSYMGLPLPEADLAEAIAITARNLAALKRPDGGFSRELRGSPAAPNVAQVKEGEWYPEMPEPVPLGLGLVEGDMNAGTQAHLIRLQCYELAGLAAPQLPEAAALYAKMGLKAR